MPISFNEIQSSLLNIIAEYRRMSPETSFEQGEILQEVSKRLEPRNSDEEAAVLTVWYDLFRSGYLAWGLNLLNPDPPFCHLTDQGRRTLQHLSRDPANPDGYTAHLSKIATLNPIALSYVREALRTYAANCFRATAVMVGAAAESVVLDVRDAVIEGMKRIGQHPPKELSDWRVKRILEALSKELEMKQKQMPADLVDNFRAYWPAFTQQIRAARNEAGHPSTLDPVTPETVHASLLVFPELAALSTRLMNWARDNYK